MGSLLQRKLIVVTGKGGAGKSTIAAALGALAARRRLRTLVADLGEHGHLAELYGAASAAQPGTAIELEPGLFGLSLDPDRATIEWMRDLGGRLPARVLASSSSFQYFAAAAPGARELVSLVKLHDLCAEFDLVVLDAPATGHALAMLASPRTFASIVRNGPLARRAGEVRELLCAPSQSGYLAVARASEMAVTETLELAQALRQELGRDLDAVVVNGVITPRFTRAELERIEALAGGVRTHRADGRATDDEGATDDGGADEGTTDDKGATDDGGATDDESATAQMVARAARSVGERGRAQRRQTERLRRDGRRTRVRAPEIVKVPFAFVPEIDRQALELIAAPLARSAAIS